MERGQGDDATPMGPELWSVAGRDGSVWDFQVKRGGPSSPGDAKFANASSATHRHADGSESSMHWNEFDGHMQLASISLRPELRGAGLGLELYVKLVQEAAGKGKGFHSDSTVSSEALKLYPKLEAMGCQVQYASDQDVVGIPHVPRDEFDTSRPAGSIQFIGREGRAVAKVLAPGQAKQASLPPIYLMQLMSSSKSRSDMAAPAPPLPAPLELPAASGLASKLALRRESAQTKVAAMGKPKL